MAARNKTKQASKLLFYFAIALLVVSLIVFFVNIDKFFKITGKAIGTANLTIESVTNINFTTNNINWGSGSVSSGQASATLNTAAGANNVTNGNWTGNTAGLVIANIGNNNVSIDLKTGKTNATLLGGTTPDYEYNVTNVESGSCLNSTGGTDGLSLGSFSDVNTTDPGTRVCGRFRYATASNTIRIDIKLIIPSDSVTGAVGDIITATATGV